MIPEQSSNDRYASLDGLRGLLALLALGQHSLYWYGKSTK
jgi:peptidoglycan/LPS O-acetylase OafA/YrhL